MLYRHKQKSLINHSGKEEVKFTLIFAPAKHKRWLNKILKPGFGHVRVVIHRRGCTLMVDPRLAYNDFECYLGNVSIEPSEGETILRGRVMVDIYKNRRIAGPLNCVETVKAFIGERSFWCFTPYQLYKKVKRYGYDPRR